MFASRIGPWGKRNPSLQTANYARRISGDRKRETIYVRSRVLGVIWNVLGMTDTRRQQGHRALWNSKDKNEHRERKTGGRQELTKHREMREPKTKREVKFYYGSTIRALLLGGGRADVLICKAIKLEGSEVWTEGTNCLG